VDQSLLTRGLILGSFGNSTSNTSKFIVLIVLWFMSLLYSLALGNRVIVRSVSVVLGLGIFVHTLYLARFAVTMGVSDSLLGVSVIHIPLGGKVGISVPGLSIL